MNYNHLNINERTIIAQLRKAKVSIREISKILQRSPSTISREIKRNSFKSGIHHAATLYNLLTHRINMKKERITVDVEKLMILKFWSM